MTVVRLTGNKTNRTFRDVPVIDDNHRKLMLYHWSQRRDTKEIASRIGLLEWQVANELPRLREASRATVQ